MTESEALEKLKLEGKLEIGGEPKRLAEFLEALFVAEEALKKVQALEENKTYQIYREYLSIGTVSEFRELKEKATAKKPIPLDEKGEYNKCPTCGGWAEDSAGSAYGFCPNCGTEFDWSEGKE